LCFSPQGGYTIHQKHLQSGKIDHDSLLEILTTKQDLFVKEIKSSLYEDSRASVDTLEMRNPYFNVERPKEEKHAHEHNPYEALPSSGPSPTSPTGHRNPESKENSHAMDSRAYEPAGATTSVRRKPKPQATGDSAPSPHSAYEAPAPVQTSGGTASVTRKQPKATGDAAPSPQSVYEAPAPVQASGPTRKKITRVKKTATEYNE
jgi:hypothetical protein